MLSSFYIRDHIKEALKEDISFGDITTENLTENGDTLSASLNTRTDGILCGTEVFKSVFKLLSEDVEIKFYFKDGDRIEKGDKLADVSGSAKAILMGERVALNYIQRMSGIATETNKYCTVIGNLPARIADTRKTTPNFRAFEKYAVKTGGGIMHRFGLSDCAMIKDNHIKFAGSITNAVNRLRSCISHAHKIEVECNTLDQVKESLQVHADIIMLDNMPCDEMKEACEMINKSAIVEASGNVTLDTVRKIAECGVDIISSSAIVAKAPALDFGLDM